MKNRVAAFQRTIFQFIKEENLSNTYAYLDNVTVAGSNQLGHDHNVKTFIDAIFLRNFTLNENKAISSVSDIKILGYVVGNKCIKPDPERTKLWLNLPQPDNFKALRRMLGMFAYYAKWISSFADKVRPLAECKIFPLTDSALKSFELLKTELARGTLQSIDESLSFTVKYDASDIAVSATLSLGDRPTVFMSRTLQRTERHYSIFEKEATGIIEAVRKWSHLLWRYTFTPVTD